MEVKGHLKVRKDLDLADTVRRNDATIFNRAFTVESPTATDDITLFLAEGNMTVTNVQGIVVGSSTPSVEFYIKFNSDRTAIGESVLGNGQTLNSTTTAQSFTPTGAGQTITDGDWVWLENTTISGIVNEMNVTLSLRLND